MKTNREIDAVKVCKACGSVRRMTLKTGYTQCRDCHNARGREYHKIHRRKYPYNKTDGWKGYQRKWQLKARYGITEETIAEMLERQNNACAICKQTDGRKLCVDHSHVNGLVRGMLCHNCNTGLANFKDNLAFLDSAKAYLCLAALKAVGVAVEKS